MHGFEEEADGAVLGACPVALLLDDGTKHLGILPGERMRQMAAPGAVDAQEDGEQERAYVPGDVCPTESGDGLGDAVGQGEQRGERVLDGEEGSLDGGLGRGRSLLLRGVLDAEGVVGVAGRLREVGRALVGQELESLASTGGVGDDAVDELCGLVLGQGEGFPEVLLAGAEILHGDELEVDAQEPKVGGVAAELGAGGGHVEREAPVCAVVATGRRR